LFSHFFNISLRNIKTRLVFVSFNLISKPYLSLFFRTWTRILSFSISNSSDDFHWLEFYLILRQLNKMHHCLNSSKIDFVISFPLNVDFWLYGCFNELIIWKTTDDLHPFICIILIFAPIFAIHTIIFKVNTRFIYSYVITKTLLSIQWTVFKDHLTQL